MTCQRWLRTHTHRLTGKTVALTGATGGIGRELCRYLAELGASLILLDRDPIRSAALAEELVAQFPDIQILRIPVDLTDIDAVKRACEKLRTLPVDVLIHNAGAYSIPRRTCETGLDNVFQINFASPYYLTRELLPTLRQRGGRVVAVGSIAHTYSVTDPADVDFAGRQAASLVYGNAKRYLMYALFGLFAEEKEATLAVAHPGITFTNITAHYPPWLFALIKHPMKVIFMKPKRACLSILWGVFTPCGDREWIGPRWSQVWGLPRKRRLATASPEEAHRICDTAERLYAAMKEN